MSQSVSKLDHDAIVVGAGFGGIYMLHKLRNELGLNAVAFDRAAGVGGTWYWNRYPGALSDSLSHLYCYAFSDDLLQQWTFRNRYVSQPEALAYLQHVVDRFDLGRSIHCNTTVTKAEFDEDENMWRVTFDRGEMKTCRFFITSVGVVDKALIPDILGQDKFDGIACHTSAWPQDLDVTGKRVAVIGSGSTGTQLVSAIAPIAAHVTAFIRSPQYSVPIGNRPLTDEEIAHIKANYRSIWDREFASSTAFGIEGVPEKGSCDVSEEEREAAYEHAWNFGGPFHFFVGTFNDVLTDPAANELAADFIRRKIKTIVKDPAKARKLTPTEPWARRPVADTGFYESFNRDNVEIESLKDNPIAEITETGIRMANGVEHPADVIAYATGFDGVTGSLNWMDIRGVNEASLREQWRDQVRSYFGVGVSNFPNMFTVYGPYGPFANNPPMIASQVEFIADLIAFAAQHEIVRIGVRSETERAYVEACEEMARGTLMYSVDSWINGGNIPGKPRQFMFNMSGLGEYRRALMQESDNAYPGFILQAEADLPSSVSQVAVAP